jgi:hypothetical protein
MTVKATDVIGGSNNDTIVIFILMISDNVEFLPPIFMPCFGSHFENGRHLENFENAELLL